MKSNNDRNNDRNSNRLSFPSAGVVLSYDEREALTKRTGSCMEGMAMATMCGQATVTLARSKATGEVFGVIVVKTESGALPVALIPARPIAENYNPIDENGNDIPQADSQHPENN